MHKKKRPVLRLGAIDRAVVRNAVLQGRPPPLGFGYRTLSREQVLLQLYHPERDINITAGSSDIASEEEPGNSATAMDQQDSTSNAARPGSETFKKPKKKKVLLMGKSGSGKSSMRSIIFSNYLARDTRRLGATIDIDLSNVKFLGNLTLNLWDCGGQEAFMENYLSQQRVHVFSNVGVLIYVFDIESRDVDRDLATYVSILSALQQYSPGANIFILVHKMDLVQHEVREQVFVERVRLIRQKTQEFALSSALRAAQVSGAPALAQPEAEIEITPFATSIWDQSLYKAWASIIHDLVPNLAYIEQHLDQLGRGIEAEELMLFERTSFLVVSQWTSEEGQRNPFTDRQERMSNIIKQWKQSISRYTGTPRSNEQFVVLNFKCMNFALFICKFTINTYLLVVLPPGEARYNLAVLNVEIARETFAFLDSPASYPRQPAVAAPQPEPEPDRPSASSHTRQSTESTAGTSASQPDKSCVLSSQMTSLSTREKSPDASARQQATPSSTSTTEVEASISEDEPSNSPILH